MAQPEPTEPPSFFKWSLSVAASAGLTGMLCCVAPMVLFMTGLMGGAYAISFADFFYMEDGSPGVGAWVLRAAAVILGGVGLSVYRTRQNTCSIDPRRKRTNLILMVCIVAIIGVAIFLSLEALSSWYFDQYIVPAQQRELGLS